MNLNATLLGQMITFALFVLFTMKYVWPPITAALKDRQEKIAKGIEDSEKATAELERAKKRASEELRQAKVNANELIAKAKKQADKMIEEAKAKGETERKRIVDSAQAENEQAKIKLKEELRKEVLALALAGAEKIISHSVNDAANQDLIEQLIEAI